MRRLVLGDVHGNLRALEQVFERSAFHMEQDELIFLGDVCDGWPDTKGCIDLLLSVKNLVPLMGNHDTWFSDWALGRTHAMVDRMWYGQGGAATLRSYGLGEHIKEGWGPILCAPQGKIPKAHLEYLKYMKSYHIVDRKLFVHAGCGEPFQDPKKSEIDILIWDRDMWTFACHGEGVQTEDFDEIFIGHTSTSRIDPTLKPVNRGKVWNLDQGAGWEGKLTLMDIDTKEYWQSALAQELYPNVKGRR